MGLKKRYPEDKPFHLSVKKLLALAFVPVPDVIQAFELIADDLNDDDGEELLDYFEPTWIGESKRRRTGRKKDEFPIELWNVYDRICTNLPRFNNSIEGWYQAFAKRAFIVHPTISTLPDKSRREHSKFEIDIVRIRQGCEPKPKKAAHRKLNEQIKQFVDDCPNVDLGEYLRGVAANMSM